MSLKRIFVPDHNTIAFRKNFRIRSKMRCCYVDSFCVNIKVTYGSEKFTNIWFGNLKFSPFFTLHKMLSSIKSRLYINSPILSATPQSCLKSFFLQYKCNKFFKLSPVKFLHIFDTLDC